jgi:hypothetical protein
MAVMLLFHWGMSLLAVAMLPLYDCIQHWTCFIHIVVVLLQMQ